MLAIFLQYQVKIDLPSAGVSVAAEASAVSAAAGSAGLASSAFSSFFSSFFSSAVSSFLFRKAPKMLARLRDWDRLLVALSLSSSAGADSSFLAASGSAPLFSFSSSAL